MPTAAKISATIAICERLVSLSWPCRLCRTYPEIRRLILPRYVLHCYAFRVLPLFNFIAIHKLQKVVCAKSQHRGAWPAPQLLRGKMSST